MSKNVLFVTWDGPEVNYLESLFVPIFEQLKLYGYKFHVLQFGWGDSERQSKARKACEEKGIPYRHVRIMRRPSIALGSALTILLSKRALLCAIKDWEIDVLMPRATLPAWGVERANKKLCLPVVFDSDGLPIDEKIEFEGLTVSGFAHRLLRDIELRSLISSNAVMVRSNDAACILRERAGALIDHSKFFVVGNGRDSNLFKPDHEGGDEDLKISLGLDPDATTLVYVGSLGGKYRFDQVLSYFQRVRNLRSDAPLLVVTPSPDFAMEAIRDIPESDSRHCVVVSVAGDEVPRYLSLADLGLVFIEPSYSMRAVAPVKLGEYLLCGLPVVATVKNIGDSKSVIDPGFGFSIIEANESSFNEAAEWFDNLLESGRLPLARSNARLAGIKYFSMEAVLAEYRSCLDFALSGGGGL